ncbi:MAG: lysophospholipid acyltransferase family protein [Nitrospinae bacterium]|nr:lysophospholipid acyltransferase family protein [Nitrospinota bacterium]
MRIISGLVAPLLGYIWIYAVSLTLRVKKINAGESEEALKGSHILAFWHSRIFYMPFLFRSGAKRMCALVSPSGDGAIIAGILGLFGFHTVRGSTFQHGRRSLISLARLVRKGMNGAMIVDGSRGPARVAQPGSVYLAKLTGATIVTVAFGAKTKREINSWDRTVFPLPFSRVNVVFGKPLEIPQKFSDSELEEKRAELEAELNRITDLADKFE